MRFQKIIFQIIFFVSDQKGHAVVIRGWLVFRKTDHTNAISKKNLGPSFPGLIKIDHTVVIGNWVTFMKIDTWGKLVDSWGK